tara:strand:- start:1946 stop:2560 length:615 start_codon:yes stop_codon:yes gene_type:complete
MNVYNKRDFSEWIVNPASGRPVRVGSYTWKKLVRDRDISPCEERSNTAFRLNPKDYESDKLAIERLELEKKRIIKEIRQGKHPGIPRDSSLSRKGTSRLVYQRKKISVNDITQKAVRSAMEVVDDLRSGALILPDDMDLGTRQNLISSAITDRMVAPPSYNFLPRFTRSLERPKQEAEQRRAPYRVCDSASRFETDSEWESDSD